jgi:predicted outer membrane repeat protein
MSDELGGMRWAVNMLSDFSRGTSVSLYSLSNGFNRLDVSCTKLLWEVKTFVHLLNHKSNWTIMQPNNPKMAFKGLSIRVFFIITFFLFSPHLTWSQQRFFVKKDAPAGGNGQSWATASNNLYNTLANAGYGDEIWIAEGVYHPTSSTDRNLSFPVSNGVRLYGGFNGTETTLQQRVLGTHETILSGNIGDTALVTDNSFNVVRIFPSDSTTRLDGLTIRDGYAVSDAFVVGSQERAVCGGGVYVDGTAENTPQFFNCLFTKNTAKSFGGAVAALSVIFENFVSVRFESCVFLANNCPNGTGGGVAQRGIGPMEWKNNFYNCVFKNNKAKIGAGYNLDSDYGVVSLKIENCDFTGNEGLGGCALGLQFCPESNTPINIQNCNFRNNTGESLIFLLCFNFNAANAPSDINISDCVVENNDLRMFLTSSSSNDYKPGRFNIKNLQIRNNQFSANGFVAGISSIADSILLSEVVMENNLSADTNGLGVILGARHVQISKSMFKYKYYNQLLTFKCQSLLMNDVIINSDSNYTAISPSGNQRISYFRNNAKYAYFNNCLFGLPETRVNLWNKSNLNNPTLMIENTTVMRNCVYNNAPYFSGKPILYCDTLIIENNYFPRYDPTLHTSSTVILDTNNLIGPVTPVFRDSANADYRLDQCSPLVNAGTNVGVDTNATDLQGLPRLIGFHVDIGPHETPLIEMNGLPVVAPSCKAVATGSIQVPVSACEQVTPVLYTWNGPNGNSGTNMEGLAPGDYTITVTHSSGTSLVLQATIPEAPAVAATVQTTPVFCGTGMGGTAKIVLQSGTAPFLFNWGNGVTDSIVTGLSYGAYPVTITDAYGCTSVNTVNINRSGNLSIGFDIDLVQCHNDSSGAIVILPNNPIPPLLWQWDNGDTIAARLHLPPGIYSGTLTDAFNCGINWQVSLDNPDSLRMDTVMMVPASTQQSANGSVTASPAGGDAPYTYQWSNGAVTAINNGLMPGPYTVTVTDQRGCTFSDTYWVEVVSGTSDPDTAPILVWPNPVSDYLYLKNVPAAANFVEILRLDGQLLLQQTTDNAFQMVEVSALPAGMYLLKIGRSRLLFVKNQ